MTERQKRFVEEYLVDLNGTAAARRAGYGYKNAGGRACELLRRPDVAQAVADAMEARAKRTQIRQDEVLAELKAIAFSEASDCNGAALKVAGKLRALELLGKHLGLFEGQGGAAQEPVRILEDI